MTNGFVGIDRSLFPQRKGRASNIDPKAAAALLATVLKEGAASDGTLYDSEKEARSAAGKTKRLLDSANIPNGQIVRTQVGIPEGSTKWAFAVYLSAPSAKKAAKSK